MNIYLRLLSYLGPYRLRLAGAIGCMVVYAAMSAITLGFVAPFMKVLFERTPAAVAVVVLGGAGVVVGHHLLVEGVGIDRGIPVGRRRPRLGRRARRFGRSARFRTLRER